MAVIRLMWPFGVFLVISSAVAAAAGPIDEPLRPALEIVGAPAPAAEGTGVAGLSEASRALDPNAKPRCRQPVVDSPTEHPVRDAGPAALFRLAPTPCRRAPDRCSATKTRGPCAPSPGAAVA